MARTSGMSSDAEGDLIEASKFQALLAIYPAQISARQSDIAQHVAVE